MRKPFQHPRRKRRPLHANITYNMKLRSGRAIEETQDRSSTKRRKVSEKPSMQAAVKKFFSAKQFAVAGASSDPAKFGHKGWEERAWPALGVLGRRPASQNLRLTKMQSSSGTSSTPSQLSPSTPPRPPSHSPPTRPSPSRPSPRPLSSGLTQRIRRCRSSRRRE